jgi:DnaJ-class molecular chaperone
MDSLRDYDHWKTTPPEAPLRERCSPCGGTGTGDSETGDLCGWCGGDGFVVDEVELDDDDEAA